MARTAPPEGAPPVGNIESVFRVSDVRTRSGTLLYVGQPLAAPDVLKREVWQLFRDHGYDVSLTNGYRADPGLPLAPGEYALVAEPRSRGLDGVPWVNLAMFLATVVSTLFAGLQWYDVSLGGDPLNLLRAWPFAVAVLGVLGVHEFGHYAMSRYHDVDASLPYFIPFPTLIGTMGAVIRMKGRIPDRRALFDIGVAGPLAGLVAAVVATVVGLTLEPVTTSSELLASYHLNYPPLLQFIAAVMGEPLEFADPNTVVNPVVFGGWVGMFLTFLNLLPVGQLDGGHLVRAMLGRRQETVAAAVPAGLFGLAGYLFFLQDGTDAAGIWLFWGLFAVGLAYAGPADPVSDEPLDARRTALGVLTFLLGLACFMPVPFEIVV